MKPHWNYSDATRLNKFMSYAKWLTHFRRQFNKHYVMFREMRLLVLNRILCIVDEKLAAIRSSPSSSVQCESVSANVKYGYRVSLQKTFSAFGFDWFKLTKWIGIGIVGFVRMNCASETCDDVDATIKFLISDLMLRLLLPNNWLIQLFCIGIRMGHTKIQSSWG